MEAQTLLCGLLFVLICVCRHLRIRPQDCRLVGVTNRSRRRKHWMTVERTHAPSVSQGVYYHSSIVTTNKLCSWYWREITVGSALLGSVFNPKQDSQCTCNVTLTPVRVTFVAVDKQSYSESVSEFLPWLSSMQNAFILRRITLSSVACLALPYFAHYHIHITIFEKKNNWTWNVCVLIFSTPSLWNMSLSKIQRHIIKNVRRFSRKVLVIFAPF